MKMKFNFAFLYAATFPSYSGANENAQNTTDAVNPGGTGFCPNKSGYVQSVTASCRLPSAVRSIPHVIFPWYKDGNRDCS